MLEVGGKVNIHLSSQPIQRLKNLKQFNKKTNRVSLKGYYKSKTENLKSKKDIKTKYCFRKALHSTKSRLKHLQNTNTDRNIKVAIVSDTFEKLKNRPERMSRRKQNAWNVT